MIAACFIQWNSNNRIVIENGAGLCGKILHYIFDVDYKIKAGILGNAFHICFSIIEKSMNENRSQRVSYGTLILDEFRGRNELFEVSSIAD